MVEAEVARRTIAAKEGHTCVIADHQ